MLALYRARRGSPAVAAMEQVWVMETGRGGRRPRPQVGQGVPGGADHAEDVDVEDARPLVVGVVLDGADGADAGVADQGVQTTQFGDGPVDGGRVRRRRR